MKKKLTLIFVLAIATVTSYSQPFAKNNHLASLQIGFGGNIYNDYNYHMLIPPMGLQYEVIITDKIGIGNIGIGGYGLFSARIYDYNNAYYTNTRYHITVGARGYYHFALADFMDDPVFNKVDAYGGLMLGMTSRIEVETGDLGYGVRTPNKLYPVFDLFLGGRYYFTDNLAVMAEMGFNISYLSAGITYRIQQ